MGLFDFFGGKKAAQDQEAEMQRSAAEKKEKEMQSAMDAHADMEWPGFPRLNPINIKSDDAVVMDETVSKERKDESMRKFLSPRTRMMPVHTGPKGTRRSQMPGSTSSKAGRRW